MARVKNYEALIAAKEEQIKKAKEKVVALEKELEVLLKEQKELEVSELYEAVKKSGFSVSEIMELISEKEN